MKTSREARTPRLLVIGAVFTMLALLPVLSLIEVQAQATSRTFPETGKTVRGAFLDYWNTHGGLAQQGYPISDEMQELNETDGKVYTVQYFERAVFELHPENQPPYDVLLSLLGVFRYKEKYPTGATGQQPNATAGSVRFPLTGKQLGGIFLKYWQEHGGLPQQGYPISDEFTEVSELNGKPYRVEYFERAVFESHPENQPPYDVLLSQLGRLRYDRRYGGPDVNVQMNLTPGESLERLEEKVHPAGQPFTLSVQVSGKDAAKISQVDWNFAGAERSTLQGMNVQFNPGKPGRYTVEISVRSSDGRSRSVVGPTLSVYSPQLSYPLPKYGVAYDFGWAPTTDYPVLISSVRDGCFPAVRMDFRQREVASGRGYALYDRPVGDLRSAGISIQGILDDFGPDPFGRNNIPSPQQYAAFAFGVASRYRDQVSAWELWNEPNLDYFWPNPSAVAYAPVLKEGYLAVKYANPNAFVLLGGLGSGGQDDKSLMADFLDAVYAQGGRDYFDGVPVHPYVDWTGDRPDQIYTKMIRDVRDVMSQAADGAKPLIINEVGWHVARGGAEKQADVVRQMVSLAFENGVSAFYYFNLRDGLPAGSDFGLLDSANQLRPAYYAYKQLTGCK